MTIDEKDKYDYLCQKFESLNKEYELSYSLLLRQDMKDLPFKQFFIPRLNRKELISVNNITDFDGAETILEHNLDIIEHYINEYAQFDKDNDISAKDRAKTIVSRCHYVCTNDMADIIIEC